MNLQRAMQLLALEAIRLGNNDLFQVARSLFYRGLVK